MAGEAEIKYLDGDFRIVRPGAFVRCAVTGVADPARRAQVLERRPAGALFFARSGAAPHAPRADRIAITASPRQHQVAQHASPPPTASVTGSARADASGAKLGLPGEPRQILLGGHEGQPFALGAFGQGHRFAAAIAVMVGERATQPARRCRPSRRVAKNFSGSPIPAKASTGRPRSAASACGSGSSRPWNTGRPRWRAAIADDLARRALPDHQHRMGAVELRRRAAPAADRPETPGRCRCRAGRRPPRSSRFLASDGFWKPSSITIEPAPAARAAFAPADAVARHDGRRRAREQQRLVADVGRGVACRHRPAPGPPAAPP